MTYKENDARQGIGMQEDEKFMREAIRLSRQAVEHGNEPFGAVLVKNGEIVFSNENQIYTRHDPTFHGEAGLIREFCAQTAITDLREYTLYSSCEPCFMCSGAIVWVKLGRLVYGASNMELEHILGNEGCHGLHQGAGDQHCKVDDFAGDTIAGGSFQTEAVDKGAEGEKRNLGQKFLQGEGKSDA